MIKQFKQFENRSEQDKGNMIKGKLTYKLSDIKMSIKQKLDLIDLLELKLKSEYDIIYNSYDYPRINDNIDIHKFRKTQSMGKSVNSFYDTTDSLMETHIIIYENYITWQRREYNIIYISKEHQIRLKSNEFNI